MNAQVSYLYLLSPLHTGGASQEGNLVGIARESHTDLPYLPSSTIRGRLRASTPETDRNKLWGNTIADVMGGTNSNLTQGTLWVGDACILWFPVPSLSHGVVWVSSPLLLRRWLRLQEQPADIPAVGSFSGGDRQKLYLKDAIFRANQLTPWQNWRAYLPEGNSEIQTIDKVLVLSDRDCQVLIQSSLWRQVRVNLDDSKIVQGGFRYEEAIPPETLMFFAWNVTVTAHDNSEAVRKLQELITDQHKTWQFGGQESLGRGFVELWSVAPTSYAASETVTQEVR